MVTEGTIADIVALFWGGKTFNICFNGDGKKPPRVKQPFGSNIRKKP
jgi:hypothetical protein